MPRIFPLILLSLPITSVSHYRFRTLTCSNWFRRPWNNSYSVKILLGWLLVCVLVGCKTDYRNLPAFSENKQLQAVILTPAGSNSPQAYDAAKKEFRPATDAGLTAQIKFLPVPGNWGFIPSTKYRNEKQEDKLLDILVLSENVPTGTIQEVIPISTLLLDVEGELTPIIIAVPARPSEQVIAATDYEAFSKEYSVAKEILQQWFLHYQPEKTVRLVSWKNEKYTDQFIRKWLQ